VLNTLIRRDVPVFPPALIPYLVDVHDHAIRAIDTLDLHRDLLAGTMEAHLSATSNRLNQSMLRMTAVTICLMVPTLIAGIYGMNFRNMPELEWEWGYLFALGLIAASTSALVAMFRRIGWL
jgi:magnesium transporter